jgi:hypothetical protein
LEVVMARALKKIAFVIEEFGVPSPTQQWLDRFLIGYPRDGRFHRLDGCQIAAWTAGDASDNELDRRAKDFGLTRTARIEEALAGAEAIVVAWRGAGTSANDALLKRVLELSPKDCACFVSGVLASSLEAARAAASLAASRKVRLLAGTASGFSWRLPDVDVPMDTRLKEALIVVQGSLPEAELDALEALLPLIERRRGGETGVRSVRSLHGGMLWQAAERQEWSWPLLAAAVSRSDNPQGDPVKDGRTQDIVGLGLVPKLAADARGWLIEHRDGLRTTILVLDGVVTDYNFAIQTHRGEIISAQLFRGPPPAQHHFSRAAGMVEEFFQSGRASRPIERNLLIVGLLAIFREPAGRTEGTVKTPELGFSYRARA